MIYNHPITRSKDGIASWIHQTGDKYRVSITETRNYITCYTWAHASGINIRNGSKWLIRDGRKYLIQRITN